MNRRILAASVALAAALSVSTALVSADAAPGHRTVAPKPGAFTVTATVNKAEPLVGTRVKIKGSVKPAAPGKPVVLQRRYADQKTWTSVARTTVSATGEFTFKDKVKTVRARKYRVVKPAGPRRAAGRSPALRVTVFGWRALTSLSPATSQLMDEVTSVSMDGVGYDSSVRAYPPYPPFPPDAVASIDYNLNRDCKAFEATVGLEDSSPGAGSAHVQVSTDGTSRYAGDFALTQSAPVAFDLAGVFRLSFAATSTAGGLAAIGSPRVLCSF